MQISPFTSKPEDALLIASGVFALLLWENFTLSSESAFDSLSSALCNIIIQNSHYLCYCVRLVFTIAVALLDYYVLELYHFIMSRSCAEHLTKGQQYRDGVRVGFQALPDMYMCIYGS